jgi:hypothetical protein
MAVPAGPIMLATAGALAGTRLPRHIPERAFLWVVSLAVLALGHGLVDPGALNRKAAGP